MKYIAIIALITMSGCGQSIDERLNPNNEPIVIDKQLNDYNAYVGHMVILKGTVTNSKHPHLLGIGCWKLDPYRNKALTVLGRISKNEVTEQDVERMMNEMIAHEGSGVFYELDEIIIMNKPD